MAVDIIRAGLRLGCAFTRWHHGNRAHRPHRRAELLGIACPIGQRPVWRLGQASDQRERWGQFMRLARRQEEIDQQAGRGWVWCSSSAPSWCSARQSSPCGYCTHPRGRLKSQERENEPDLIRLRIVRRPASAFFNSPDPLRSSVSQKRRSLRVRTTGIHFPNRVCSRARPKESLQTR